MQIYKRLFQNFSSWSQTSVFSMVTNVRVTNVLVTKRWSQTSRSQTSGSQTSGSQTSGSQTSWSQTSAHLHIHMVYTIFLLRVRNWRVCGKYSTYTEFPVGRREYKFHCIHIQLLTTGTVLRGGKGALQPSLPPQTFGCNCLLPEFKKLRENI